MRTISMFRHSHHLRAVFLLIVAFVLLVGVVDAQAQLGSRETQAWIQELERPQRIADLKIDEVVRLLNLKTGQNVADIGAGTGVFSLPLARAVAPSGKVYAVDIDPGLLDYITQKARKEDLGNIQTVKGEFSDPKLPNREVDLGFINDVLHHIENRQAYLKVLATYMKSTGRIAIIDNNRDDPKNPHRNTLKCF